MAIIQNWKIQSRSKSCAETGEPFRDGDIYVTCIFEDPDSDGFLREDLSEAAWKARIPDRPPFSHWKAKFEVPALEEVSEDPSQLRKGDAEILLQNMIDDDDPRLDKARYILAAKLEREKRIKQVDVRQIENRRLLIYEHRKTGEVLIVTDPEIRLEEVDQIQEEVVAMLDQLVSRKEDDGTEEAGPAPP